jgi:hypothetical protein
VEERVAEVASPGGTRERAAKRRHGLAAAAAAATAAAEAATAAAVAAGELGEGSGCVLAGGSHVGSSRFKGVSWNKACSKWWAQCKGKYLGLHTTEEDAARACSKYLKDHIDPAKHRKAIISSQFMGVSWNKACSKWKTQCDGKYLGLHTTEKAAALAYNVEAKRVGRPLNVIPPTRAAGAGAGACAGSGVGAGLSRDALKTPATPATNAKTKRAAPMTPATSARSKMMKL